MAGGAAGYMQSKKHDRLERICRLKPRVETGRC
jgi:hypothetical protein